MNIPTEGHQITRLEIVDTGRRRRWSESEKLRIVEESQSASRLASTTARRHWISKALSRILDEGREAVIPPAGLTQPVC
jgi:transposase